MKLFYLPLLCWLIFLSSYAQDRRQTLLLHHVNIIHVETGAVQRNASILLEGDKIKAVGEFNKLKKGVAKADQVDGQGKFLIPGLWDMHVHLEGAEMAEDNKALLPLFLAYGITTIRDCASDLGEQVLAWRNEINAGDLIGPTIYTAGRKLEGKNSIWKGDLEIENEIELNQMMDLLDTYRVDFVKITENTLSGELFLKSVKAAHARGYRVSGHVPYDLTIEELVKAGYSSVEHASYLLRLGSDQDDIKANVLSGKITKAEAEARYAAEFNQQKANERYKALGSEGLFVCPTLIGARQLAYLSETDHTQDEMMDYLTEKYVANYQWRIQRMGKETEEQRQARKDRYLFLRGQLPLMHGAGIKIIAGSDAAALNTYVYPAESLLQELEIFQEAGLTPLQILQTAILNGHLYFGRNDAALTLSAGKNADLVLLDKNPLENSSALRSVNSVIAQGNYYNRTTLDGMLKSAHEKKLQLDALRK